MRATTSARSSFMALMSDSVPSFVVSLADLCDLSLAISVLMSFTNCVDVITSLSRSFLIDSSESVRSESECASVRSCSFAWLSHAASSTTRGSR